MKRLWIAAALLLAILGGCLCNAWYLGSLTREMNQLLEQAGQERGLSIRIQREDIFNAMHRI